MQFGHRPQFRMPQQTPLQQQQGEGGFDGKMLRKAMARKTVDYNPSVLKYLENRIWQRDYRDTRALQPDLLYTQMLTPPQAMTDNPINCVTGKFIRAALNKDPRPVFCVCWTPDGRRLITGASSGEFTLWNGLTFNFETILQAHNSAVRAMIWSHNEQWMLTGDDKGFIKYWQANMNNVHMFQGHLETIRGLSFSPTDAKFVSCSDDRKVRIFDFVTSKEENILEGHGSDVKCVDWHPHKALIISGSKDSQQPIILWDARNAKKLTTLHAHKNTCTDLKWNQFNGNWLISSSRDHLCKLFDLRNLKEEVQSFRGHKKEASTVSWHPIYEKLFVSGGNDGSLFFWMCGSEKEVGTIDEAHESIIWDLSWHPLGHMLVSGSNDRSTRFWTRHRPGDTVNDKADEAPKVERVTGIIFRNIDIPDGSVALPGLGLDKESLDNSVEKAETEEHEEAMSPSTPTEPVQQQQQQQQPQVQLQPQQQPQQQQIVKKELVIPGLDFEEDDGKKRKAPYAKPIPKEFEKAWKSNKPIQNTQMTPQTNDLNQFQMTQQPQPSGLMAITPLMNLKSSTTAGPNNFQNPPIPLMAQSSTGLQSLMGAIINTNSSNSIDTNEKKTEFWSENLDDEMDKNNKYNNNNRRFNNNRNNMMFDGYNDDEDNNNNNNFGGRQRQQKRSQQQSSYNQNRSNNNKNNNNMNLNDIDSQDFRSRFNDNNYDYDNNNDYDENEFEGNDDYDDNNDDNDDDFDNDDENNIAQSDENNINSTDDVQPKGKRARLMSGNNRNYQPNNNNYNNRNNNNRKGGAGGGGGGGYNNNRNRMNNNKNFNNNRRGGNNSSNSANNYNNNGGNNNNNNNRY